MLRKVAALAAGDALCWRAEGKDPGISLERISEVWRTFYGDAANLESVRRELRRSVY
jgi:hypothetical protein